MPFLIFFHASSLFLSASRETKGSSFALSSSGLSVSSATHYLLYSGRVPIQPAACQNPGVAFLGPEPRHPLACASGLLWGWLERVDERSRSQLTARELTPVVSFQHREIVMVEVIHGTLAKRP
jgi:hypothetical protein